MDIIPEVTLPLWAEIGLAISVMVFGFLAGSLRQIIKFHNKGKKDKEIDWKVHSDIHELLTELRFSTDSARTQLVQFHNGEYFMDGVSMKKLSLTHESLSSGVSADGEKLKGLLISLFAPVITKVINDDPIIYLTKDEPDSFYKNFFLSSNINAYCILPIKHENNISGFVIIHWCSATKVKKAVSNSEEIGKRFIQIRNQIQIQLEEQMRVK